MKTLKTFLSIILIPLSLPCIALGFLAACCAEGLTFGWKLYRGEI